MLFVCVVYFTSEVSALNITSNVGKDCKYLVIDNICMYPGIAKVFLGCLTRKQVTRPEVWHSVHPYLSNHQLE